MLLVMITVSSCRAAPGDTGDYGRIRLGRDRLSIDVCLEPFGFRVLALDNSLVAETCDYAERTSLFYRRKGILCYPESFEFYENTEDGVILHYRTTDEAHATISLSFENEHRIRVAFDLQEGTGTRDRGALYVGQDMRLFPEEAIYGLCERIHWRREWSETDPREIGSLDRRGERVPMVVMGTIGVYTPFYHSSRGYGLFVNSTYYGCFDLGWQRSDRLRYYFLAESGNDPLLDYYIYYGPNHDGILDEYTSQTGRPFVPPLWAFRHWRWRNELEMVYGELDGNIVNGQLAEDVSMYDELAIPVGGYLIDRPYTPGELGFAEFSFNPVRFPNEDVMRQSLFDRGYHLLVWGGPWAVGWEEGQNGWEAELRGYYAPGDRKHIDYTNPEAYLWWKEKVKAFVLEKNIHGWKLDRGDENHPSRWEDIYFDGRRGVEMRNAYPPIYQACYFDAMQEAWGGDFVNIFRAGYTGSQRYGVVWAGDTPGAVDGESTDLGLRSAILSQLHCAFMGFPLWGSDTGGFREFRDREIFARWLQFSAFCPVMEIGGTGAHAPWDMPTEPSYDEEMIEIYRTYTTLHHSLADYIHTNALESGRTGAPVVRPMIFDYPEDPTVKDMWDQYFFGRDFLVAPVWRSGQRDRDVYIPEGEFVDYWDPQHIVTGPVVIVAEAPLDRIPLFVRREALRPEASRW